MSCPHPQFQSKPVVSPAQDEELASSLHSLGDGSSVFLLSYVILEISSAILSDLTPLAL